jgi:cytoskeletal protein RodZ
LSDTPGDVMGHRLHEARDKKGWSLEEAEKATRIRARFLEALEADDYAALPSGTQARGFLKIYAEYLGLDAGQVIDWYDAWRKKPRAQIPFPITRPAKPRSKAPDPAALPDTAPRAPTRPASRPPPSRVVQVRSRRLRWLSPDVFVAVAITVVLGVFLVWGVLEFVGGQGFSPTETPTPTPSPAGSFQAPTATPTAPIEATATAPLPTPLAFYSGVDLIVRAEQRIWVSVAVDGAEAYVGQMLPGTSKEFKGQNVVELTTSNGLGTHVIWNGRDQGTLGLIGENVIRLWTTAGPMTPTPTITLTPSQTLTPTSTPKP